jgi:hypothetical protein
MAATLKRPRHRDAGQALVEYTIGLLVVYWILFYPEFWGGGSAVTVLMNAFQKNYQGYEYAQSQPALD